MRTQDIGTDWPRSALIKYLSRGRAGGGGGGERQLVCLSVWRRSGLRVSIKASEGSKRIQGLFIKNESKANAGSARRLQKGEVGSSLSADGWVSLKI